MLSGGLDSTYVLAKLLRETDNTVIAHHIHLITNIGRYEPEAISCRKIVDYCQREFRTFEYSFNTIDRRGYLAHGRDILTAAFEAGTLAASYYLATGNRVDQFRLGRNSADSISENRLEQANTNVQPPCYVPPCYRVSGTGGRMFKD